MTQLILASMRLARTPIDALRHVSAGLNQSLTPWYINENANLNIDHDKNSKPLSWKTVKSLHATSPTFPFATKLSIKIESEQEMNEFIDSDAAKSLFKQAHTLHLTLPTVFEPRALSDFVKKFGLLERFYLNFRSEKPLPQSVHFKNVLTFFNKMFSPRRMTGAGRDLTFHLVTSLQKWHNNNNNNNAPKCPPDCYSVQRRVLAQLVKLMVEFHKIDDGKSIVTFLHCISAFSPRRSEGNPVTRKLYDTVFAPMFDLLQRLILNNDFIRIMSRLLRDVESFPQRRFPRFGRSLVSTSADQNDLRVISDIVNIVICIAWSRDRQLVSHFVQNYGDTVLRAFSRIVVDTRIDRNGGVDRYLNTECSGSKSDYYFDVVYEMFRAFAIMMEKHSSSSSTPVCELFPLDIFHEVIQFSSVFYSENIYRVIWPLLEAVRKSNSRLNSNHHREFSKIAATLFDMIRGFDLDEAQNFERPSHVGHRLSAYKAVLSPLMDSLDTVLFGSNFSHRRRHNNDDDDSNVEANRVFHENVRSSMMILNSSNGTTEERFIDEMLNWGKKLVMETKRAADNFEEYRAAVRKRVEKEKQKSSDQKEGYFACFKRNICSVLPQTVVNMIKKDEKSEKQKSELDVKLKYNPENVKSNLCLWEQCELFLQKVVDCASSSDEKEKHELELNRLADDMKEADESIEADS